MLDELNDAFCKTHPWLAQKVCTRSAHAAVSEVCAGALLNKALSMRRKKAGEFLHDVRATNAIKLTASDILAGVRYHVASAEPFFLRCLLQPHKAAWCYSSRGLNGRCVMAEEVGDRHCGPLRWKCTKECRLLTSCETDIVMGTKVLLNARKMLEVWLCAS